jgi:hypothetical protein
MVFQLSLHLFKKDEKFIKQQSSKQETLKAHSDKKAEISASKRYLKIFIWQAIVRGRPILRRAIFFEIYEYYISNKIFIFYPARSSFLPATLL